MPIRFPETMTYSLDEIKAEPEAAFFLLYLIRDVNYHPQKQGKKDYEKAKAAVYKDLLTKLRAFQRRHAPQKEEDSELLIFRVQVDNPNFAFLNNIKLLGKMNAPPGPIEGGILCVNQVVFPRAYLEATDGTRQHEVLKKYATNETLYNATSEMANFMTKIELQACRGNAYEFHPGDTLPDTAPPPQKRAKAH